YRLSGCKVRSHKEGVSIMTSRGCPGKCNFCNPRGLGFGIRFNSAEYIMKVVEDLYDNFGIRELYIQDDMFTANRDNVLRFCALLQQSRFNIPWTCNARVDFIDTELLKEMKNAGCWQIGFGFESGSQKILDTIGKKVTVEDNYKCTLYCKEVGMEVMGLFMIGCFNETEESIMETLSFIKKSFLTDLQVTYYTPLPGTASWKQWPKFGDFDQNTDIAFHTEPAFVPYGMTKEQLIAYQKKMYFRFYMNPRTLFKYFANLFKPDVSMRFIQTLIGFVSFLFIKNKSKINFLKTRINE
ncbi:MAG: B12-binding domain-containing radical SAM protein, partial [Thermodesulfobacteriota bacterium]